MAGRKKIEFDNRAVMLFLDQYREAGVPIIISCPTWVENCAASARCYGGNRPSSSSAILTALSQLPELSHDTVERYVNRKRIAMKEKPYSKTHSQSFATRLRMASKAISYYHERIIGQSITVML